MKNPVKWMAALIIAAAMLLPVTMANADGNEIPEYIRVGLYYTEGSTKTSLSVFGVSASKGLTAGFTSGNAFVEICKAEGSSTFYVRKDTHYYREGKTLKEYAPSKTTDESVKPFEKYGPYHIKIGSDCPDAASAGALSAEYNKKGINSYIAYKDAWQVWTGCYPNEAEANGDLKNISAALGDAGYTVLTPCADGIVLTDSDYRPLCIFSAKSAFFQIRPSLENNPSIFKINEKTYRGALEVRRLSSSDMTVINVVSVQEYLYGNVPAEIGGRSPAEAIKAQALASKMYAINNLGKHGKTGFDVCATTSCQVYRGYSIEVPECNSAIDEVKDKIITYDGKPAKHIYYFASSGGRTEDVSNVWGSSYPYLVSVEDKYEKIYTWTKTLRTSDIKRKLPELGNILGISIARTAESGRVTQLAVRGTSSSEPAVYSREKTRTLFGLDSQLYTIMTDADVYVSSVAVQAGRGAGINKITDAASINSVNSNEQTKLYTSNEEVSQTFETVTLEGINVITSSGIVKLNESEGNVTIQGANGSIQTDSAILSADLKPVVPDIKEPAGSSGQNPIGNTSPQKTQLGGSKVVTATGIASIAAKGNKVTIMGAGGTTSKVTLVPETYTFIGKGWGHAVGMSQEGAIGMAKAGKSYEEIITHYFQGTEVE